MSDHIIEPKEAPLRRCPKCGEWKPRSSEYFALNKNRKDGFEIHCKTCKRSYYRANKDTFAAKFHVHYEQNKEAKLEYARNYRATNKENIAEFKKVWRAKNKNRLQEKEHSYYAENKDRSKKKIARMERK